MARKKDSWSRFKAPSYVYVRGWLPLKRLTEFLDLRRFTWHGSPHALLDNDDDFFCYGKNVTYVQLVAPMHRGVQCAKLRRAEPLILSCKGLILAPCSARTARSLGDCRSICRATISSTRRVPVRRPLLNLSKQDPWDAVTSPGDMAFYLLWSFSNFRAESNDSWRGVLDRF